jgi:hypothetical protein
MKPPVIRNVIITDRDLPTLMRRSLGKGEFGKEALYDTVDFRILTEQDLTLELLKNPIHDSATPEGQIRRWIKRYHLYREDYHYWLFRKQDRLLQISPHTGRNRHRWDNLGMATLTKTFS